MKIRLHIVCKRRFVFFATTFFTNHLQSPLKKCNFASKSPLKKCKFWVKSPLKKCQIIDKQVIKNSFNFNKINFAVSKIIV